MSRLGVAIHGILAPLLMVRSEVVSPGLGRRAGMVVKSAPLHLKQKAWKLNPEA